MRACMGRVKTRMVVAVLVVALVPWAIRVASVSRAHRLQAEEFKKRHEHNRYMAAAMRMAAAALRYSPYEHAHRRDARQYARYKQLAEYYFALAEKYRRAAWRPWYAVGPDPPPPGVVGPVDDE